MQDAQNPQPQSLVQIEIQDLREIRTILSEKGLSEAENYAKQRQYPRLWKVIGESSLEALNFDAASKALVKALDYQGLQFVKRLKKLDDPKKKLAETAAFHEQFEKAEKIYLDMDRKDLAVDLRKRTGDWFRVVQLLKTGGGGEDQQLEHAWNQIGDYYFERQRWHQAITYYIQAKNPEKLVHLYFLLEDYANVEKLAQSLNENSPLLRLIAEQFVLNGLSSQAVSVYLKIGDIAEAVNTCIQLNQWSQAIDLAETHRFKEIQTLISRYAQHILSQNRIKEAVELYRKSNLCQESATLLFQMAKEAVEKKEDPLRIKKFFVLGALEVERFHALQKSNRQNPTAALDGLLKEDMKIKDPKLLENAWRGAEAYHFYILAQRQFYSGQLESAVITALHLRDYEDVLEPVVIYSLLALVSIHAGYYGTCSKAFIRLESMEKPLSEQYKQLAVEIFTKYKPSDPQDASAVCTSCLSPMRDR
jgi:WD repeat-containing protein 35